MRTKRIILFISLGLVVPVGCLYGLLRVLSRPTGPIASARLADGRILRIEGVTYGKQHRMGKRWLLEPIEPWLPRQVAQLLAPQQRPSEVTMDEPGLVVWVNAVDAVTGKYVDCQQIRMEVRFAELLALRTHLPCIPANAAHADAAGILLETAGRAGSAGISEPLYDCARRLDGAPSAATRARG
jgi:hypothetical protein